MIVEADRDFAALSHFQQISSDANVCLDDDIPAALQGGVFMKRFTGRSYPRLGYSENEIDIFIPMAPNYPAVELISRFGSAVIACQVHISDSHLNLLPLLQSHVEKAQ